MSATIIDTGTTSHPPLRVPTFDTVDANGQGTHVAGNVVAGQSGVRSNVSIVDTGIGADRFDRGQGTHVAGVVLSGTGTAAAVVSGRAAAYMQGLMSQGVPRSEAIVKTREWLERQ